MSRPEPPRCPFPDADCARGLSMAVAVRCTVPCHPTTCPFNVNHGANSPDPSTRNR